jgi:hypothetical protein
MNLFHATFNAVKPRIIFGFAVLLAVAASCSTPVSAAYNPQNITNLATISNLTSGTWTNYPALNVLGYYSANDNGGGLFNKVTSCTPDGGTCLQDAAGNYFKRQTNGQAMVASWFGASPSATGAQNTAAVTACIASAAGNECDMPANPSGVFNLAGAIVTVSGRSQFVFDGKFATFNQQTANTPIIKIVNNPAGGYQTSSFFTIKNYGCTWTATGGSDSSNICLDFYGGDGSGIYFFDVSYIQSSGGWNTIGYDPNGTSGGVAWHANFDHIQATSPATGAYGGAVNFCNASGPGGAPLLKFSHIYQFYGGRVMNICAMDGVIVDSVERNLGTFQTNMILGTSLRNASFTNVRSEVETLNTNFGGLVELGSTLNTVVSNVELASDTINVANDICLVRTLGSGPTGNQVVFSGATFSGTGPKGGQTFTSGSAALVCPNSSDQIWLRSPENVPEGATIPIYDVDVANGTAPFVVYGDQFTVTTSCAGAQALASAICGTGYTVPTGMRLVSYTVNTSASPSAGTLHMVPYKNGAAINAGSTVCDVATGGATTCSTILGYYNTNFTTTTNIFAVGDVVSVYSGAAPGGAAITASVTMTFARL